MSLSTESQVSPAREAAEWKKGGATVAAALIGYGAGPVLAIMSASVFVKPMVAATGWSTSAVLLSPLFIVLFMAVGPLAGRVADRWGPRRTIIAGLVPFGLLIVLFALLPVSKVTFYGLAAAMGIVGSFAYMVPFNRAVAARFNKGAGKAFGVVGCGSAVVPLVAIPLITLAIYQQGWRAGYLVLAGFVLLVSLPSVVFGMREPRTHATATSAQTPPVAAPLDGLSVKQVFRTPRFWIFSGSIFAVMAAVSGFQAHLQPILLDGGLSVVLATTVTTLYSVGTIIGRLGCGTLLDAFSPRKTLVGVTIMLLSAVGCLGLAGANGLPIALIAISAILIGISHGAEADIGAYFILKEYGRSNMGTLYAVALWPSGIAGLATPYIFSVLLESTGSYAWACILGAATFLLAALCLLAFGVTGRGRDHKPSADVGAEQQPANTPSVGRS